MTCVWNSLIQGIPINQFNNHNFTKKPNPTQFTQYLKDQNTKNTSKVPYRDNIIVNGKNLTNKEKEENFEAIKNFNVGSIGGGYFCSTGDPFLIITGEIFQCSIHHNYNNHLIKYNHSNPKFTICVNSSSSHMSFTKTIEIKN